MAASVVTGNSASSVEGPPHSLANFGGTGGIDAGTATITDSTVAGNAAEIGGGVSADAVTLTRSTVSGNAALSVVANAPVGRYGGTGGGVSAGTATLANSTVSGNRTDVSGGGVWATAGQLTNSTVVENRSLTGGGVFHNPGGELRVLNTIIARNAVGTGGSGPDVSGAFVSLGHNLIGDGTGGTGFTDGVSGDIVGTSAAPIDPGVGPLARNGGPTRTHALVAGSPAIDRGDNAVLALGLTTDQRGPGFPRRKDGNGDGVAVVDIGAFER
jgi:hypothetical protein